MKRSKIVLTLVITLWLLVIVAGVNILLKYEFTPGVTASPADWPRTSKVRLAEGRPTLILFAHPACPCTRATVNELSQLVARAKTKPQVIALLLRPSSLPPNWTGADLQQELASIPGTSVIEDVDGSEARKFACATSGQVLLYNQNGQLVFTGGITVSRGQLGDNAGLLAVIDLLDGEMPGSEKIRSVNAAKMAASLRTGNPCEQQEQGVMGRVLPGVSRQLLRAKRSFVFGCSLSAPAPK